MPQKRVVTTVTKRKAQQPKKKVATTVSTVMVQKGGRKQRVPRPTFSQISREFLHCVLDPFDATKWSGSAKVPTGYNGRTVSMRDIVSVTVSPDPNGRIILHCKPGLPGSLRVMAGKFVSRGTDGANHTYDMDFTTGRPLGLIVPFPDLPVNSDTYSATAPFCFYNVRQMTRGRPISCAMTVVPVGPPVTVAGRAAIASIPSATYPSALEPVPRELQNNVTINGLTVDGGQYIQSYTAAAVAMESEAGYVFNEVSTYPSAMVCPISEACGASVRIPREAMERWTPVSCGWHSDGTLQFGTSDGCAWIEGPQFNIGGSAGVPVNALAGGAGACYGGTNSSRPNAFVCPGLADKLNYGLFWDPAIGESLVYSAVGVPADYPVQVTVAFCYEMECDPASTVRQFLSAGAPVDDRALNAAAELTRVMPTAYSLVNKGGSLLESIVHAAGNVAPMLGRLGLDYPQLADTGTRAVMRALRSMAI